MKRLLTLLFALAVAFSLTMPAFSQETGGEKAEKSEKAEKKGKKKGATKGEKKGAKKGKKEGMEKKEGESK